jgi:hypothetical protein
LRRRIGLQAPTPSIRHQSHALSQPGTVYIYIANNSIIQVMSVDEDWAQKLPRKPWRFDQVCLYLAMLEFYLLAYRDTLRYLRATNPPSVRIS